MKKRYSKKSNLPLSWSEFFWKSLIFGSRGGDRFLDARGGASPPSSPVAHVWSHLYTPAEACRWLGVDQFFDRGPSRGLSIKLRHSGVRGMFVFQKTQSRIYTITNSLKYCVHCAGQGDAVWRHVLGGRPPAQQEVLPLLQVQRAVGRRESKGHTKNHSRCCFVLERIS